LFEIGLGYQATSGNQGYGSAAGGGRKTLDTYLLCLQHSATYVKNARPGDPPEKWVAVCADAMSDCVEKSWQDYRNNLQIMLLTQDEALIWVNKIDRTLAGA
jgi:subtilase family serine protease